MRRMLILTLILSLLQPALLSTAMAETYPVAYGNVDEGIGFMLLIDDDGTPLTPRYAYSNIGAITPEGTPFEDRLYSATTLHPDLTGLVPDEYGWYNADTRRTALMNAQGELLTDFDYSYIYYEEAGNVVITFTPDGCCGVLSRTGEVLVEPVYGAVTSNGEGGYLAVKTGEGAPDDEGPYPIVCITPDGATLPTGWHSEISSIDAFRNGYCILNWLEEESGAGSVFVDAQGSQQFYHSFYSARDFLGNLAPVCRNEFGGTGLMDRRGRLVVPAVYGDIYTYGTDEDGIFVGTLRDGFALIDPMTGAVIREEHFPEEPDYVSCWSIGGRMLVVSDGENDFIYDFDGRPLPAVNDYSVNGWFGTTDATLDRVLLFSGEYPYYRYAVANLDGEIVSKDFQDIYGGIWRDGEGRLVFVTQDYLEDEEGDPYIDWSSRRLGVCDQDGNTLLEARYDDIEVLSLDRYWVRRGTRSGLIDGTGKWLYTIEDYEYLMD